MIARRRAMSLRTLALPALLAALFLALGAGAAQANTPIVSFTAVPSTSQAGGHPDLEVAFELANRRIQVSQSACNCEDAKDATVHLPAGYIGNPHATPQCTVAEFSSDSCPFDSQIGIANVITSGGLPFNSAIYNLVPPPDVAGLLGFKIFLFGTPQFTVLTARTGSDYGLDATATSIFHGVFPLQALQQVLWGVPADPRHDPLRLDPSTVPGGSPAYLGTLCDANGAASTSDPTSVYQPCLGGIPPVASNSPLSPFLQNPTTCEGSLSTTLEVLSYDGGSDSATYPWPKMTGCDQLSFNPSLFAQPTTRATDTASGIDVNLIVPQEQSPTIPSPSELRAATVTLPPGFTINPNAADGKVACSDADANFGTTKAANCPEFAKVGSLEIDSSALPGPLPGFVYLGLPLPGNRYRIFLVADGFATHVKLAGTVTPDPVTGQLKITFDDLPQSPLTAFKMHFFGSERGLLATPDQCGTYPVTSTFTPWDSSLGKQTSTQFFTLDSGPGGAPCPGPARPFSPTFEAASAGNTAGAHSPFAVELTRPDGDQNLTGLDVSAPPGFAATLKGVPYCPEAAIARLDDPGYSGLMEQASPACPAASQIGVATTGAGAGTHPLYTAGKVYLAGPYKGAPLSLVVVVPAVSGPYDLGNVAVRAAIQVDPETARVTTVSDPLPQIIGGIPLRLRSIQVDLNRPGFALNPTNCNSFNVEGAAFGDQGGRAALSYPYQAGNCASLGFGPRLALRLSGGIKRNGHPAVHATLGAKPGQANISRVAVTLPVKELLDQAHLSAPCTRAQFGAGACPPSTVLGKAVASTPILGEPLRGPVYLVTSSHALPDMVVTLHGQVDITLRGRIDNSGGGLRTTFAGVPDVPVTDFRLDLAGGKKGLIVNSRDVCSIHQRAKVQMVGQNGRRANSRVKLTAGCGAQSRRARAHHRVRVGLRRMRKAG